MSMRTVLLAGGALAALLVSSLHAQTTLTASVAIDATSSVRTVDNRMFSVNTAIWDSVLKQPSTLPLLQAADFRGLRFPGGSASDNYDWRTGTDKVQGTVWAVNFDQFASLATGLKAVSYITVNYGTSTPQDAADWVTYSNVTKKYGLQYWEIGNENYGTWEADNNPAKNDPFTYATRTKDFVTLMKAADSTIKIGVVAVTGEDSYANNSSHPVTNPRTGKVHNGWTPVMLTTLKSLGVIPDYIIYHRYEQNPGNESDSSLLLDASTWASDAADLRQQLKDYLGSAAAGVEIVCTENNSVSFNPGKQSTSLVNGLYLADSIGNLLQTEFNAMVWWDLRNGQDSTKNNAAALYGWRQYGDYGLLSGSNDPYPTYRVYELLSHFTRGGDTVIKVSGGLPFLGTYAVRRVDGSMALLVINKYSGNPVSAQFTVKGFTSGATAKVYQYGMPQDNAAQAGNTAAAGVAASTMSVGGTGFTATFAPYSATVISLPPPVVAPALVRQPLPQTVATGSTATLSVAATGTSPSYQWSLNGTPLSGATSATLVIAHAGPADAGSYTCAVTNSAGTVSSAAAAVAVTTTADFGRLINLSVLTTAGAGQKLTLGFYSGPPNSASSQRLLLRATGPALAAFGVSAFLPDPTLTLYPVGQSALATNDNWGTPLSNVATINTADSATGAFALNNSASLDAATVQSLAAGGYTIDVSGNGSSSGSTLAEVYDYTAAGAFGLTSPRLVNLSCLSNVAPGATLTAGFVIGGSTSRTVLIRANGPALTAFGVGGVMPDPQLVLVNTSTQVTVATNAGWQGDAAVAGLGGQVGAFAIADTSSKDSALVLTLSPNITYTAAASSASGAGGNVLIEIYEVP